MNLVLLAFFCQLPVFAYRYVLRTAHLKYIDYSSGSLSQKGDPAASSRWEFIPASNGKYYLRNVDSNLYLSSRAGGVYMMVPQMDVLGEFTYVTRPNGLFGLKNFWGTHLSARDNGGFTSTTWLDSWESFYLITAIARDRGGDGCSVHIPDGNVKKILDPACNMHDVCFACHDYVNNPDRVRYDSSRNKIFITNTEGWWDTLQYCNRRLKEELAKACNSVRYNPSVFASCETQRGFIDAFTTDIIMGTAYRNNLQFVDRFCARRDTPYGGGRFIHQLDEWEKQEVRAAVNSPTIQF
jgi:hypothetical protein